MESLASLLPILLILAAFWFLIIRPARSRQRQQLQLQQSLATGQEVMTTSGLYGRIVETDDETVVLDAGSGVRLRWARAAVARVVEPATGTTGQPAGTPQTGTGPVDETR